ncbi:MAG: NapC/NirT family cytochrome c [Kiritimatiellaeota bacterium]|nr:NapC/NirT family cytochrome c [Kiritimatiellota bacterium]
MTPDRNTPRPRLSIFRNWTSLMGLVVLSGSIFAFLLLLMLDVLSPNANPYMGILAYLVAPFFTVMGLALIALGLVVERRRVVRSADGQPPPLLLVDFSQPHTRRNLVVFVGAGITFLLLSAVGTYRSYHFSESSTFCGQACHTVMNPEYTTYLHSPHARISCSECHIGPGAAWYVKAKISGLYQVYAVAFSKYKRPIATPVHNLRPAQETCEQCHWPEKFSGNLDRVYAHFLSDETNTPYTVRLSLKVGGSDPTHGPVGGIHWHMNVANRVEYIASDERRQVIPWVRVTDRQGVVTEYQGSPGSGDGIPDAEVQAAAGQGCHPADGLHGLPQPAGAHLPEPQ